MLRVPSLPAERSSPCVPPVGLQWRPGVRTFKGIYQWTSDLRQNASGVYGTWAGAGGLPAAGLGAGYGKDAPWLNSNLPPRCSGLCGVYPGAATAMLCLAGHIDADQETRVEDRTICEEDGL